MANAVNIAAGSSATFGDGAKNGTLAFNGATSFGDGSALTIASRVSFNGAITAGNNITLAPNSNASLTLNSLDVKNGVTIDFDLNSSTPITFTGALTDSTLTALNFNFTNAIERVVYTILNFGSATLTAGELHMLSGNMPLNTAFGDGGWQVNGMNLQVEIWSCSRAVYSRPYFTRPFVRSCDYPTT